MIVEHRTYRITPGQLHNYMKLYEEEGLELQSRHLGDPIGWYFTDIGVLNSVIHLWQYQDINDRARRRSVLAADSAWHAYLPKVTPLIQEMRSEILLPAPFFKLSERHTSPAS
ncbi:NIPSNAP family protein [Rhizobium sp. L9]|uniref:NIPSNAP family protein n=1 Tax=Rhizobium sp. L9 TaxID=1340738 RepID=UPI000BEABD82|nr:NIPSNAP family protein [Rhizobium sp. L9]PDT30786.1 NIPSNAP family protein [Rhizobium sp. L9]